MTALLLAALAWLALHIGVSGTALRDRAVALAGEKWFRGVFTVASVLVFVALVMAYARAGTVALWRVPGWLVAAIDLLMLPACMLLVASFSRGNPTMAGTEAAFGGAVHGMFRVTRLPMMVAYGLWAAGHVLANGDSAALVFFGTILLTVVAGIPSIDRKLARRDAAKWAGLAAVTSVLPFAAILAGRNRLVGREIGLVAPLGGAALWLAMLAAHPAVIGVSPLP